MRCGPTGCSPSSVAEEFNFPIPTELGHFSVTKSRVLAILLSLAVLIPFTGQAAAADVSTGRWDSNSLRDNRIGYYMTLKSSPIGEDTYSGVLRFAYREGRKGPRMPFTATIQGDEVVMRAKKGRFDRGRGSLRGELSSDGSTLTLTNCQDRLRLVMSWALDSDCVFTASRVN